MNQKIKIKAAILEKTNRELVLKNIYHDSILSKNQILIKIQYTGICGSQLGEINGIKGKDNFLPHLLGHEATGIVKKVSKEIKDFKKNDKVILHWQKNSKNDSRNPIYYDERSKKINAGWVTTFNNYAVVSKNRVSHLPKKISMKEGVLFGCSLTTSYGSIFKDFKINLKKKNKILITGCGMIGQTIITLLNNSNKQIYALENNLKKIKFIKKNFKKINFLNRKKSVMKNYDYIYETTGNSNIIEQSYNSLSKKGKLVLIGVPKFNENVNINTLGINYGKRIVGSYGGAAVPKKDIIKILSYIKKNKVNLKKLYVGPFNFKKINLIINKMFNGQIITKPILRLW